MTGSWNQATDALLHLPHLMIRLVLLEPTRPPLWQPALDPNKVIIYPHPLSNAPLLMFRTPLPTLCMPYPISQLLSIGICKTTKQPYKRQLIRTSPVYLSKTRSSSSKLTSSLTPSRSLFRQILPLRTHPPKISLME